MLFKPVLQTMTMAMTILSPHKMNKSLAIKTNDSTAHTGTFFVENVDICSKMSMLRVFHIFTTFHVRTTFKIVKLFVWNGGPLPL